MRPSETDTITFDPTVFDDGANSVIRLVRRDLVTNSETTVDGFDGEGGGIAASDTFLLTATRDSTVGAGDLILDFDTTGNSEARFSESNELLDIDADGDGVTEMESTLSNVELALSAFAAQSPVARSALCMRKALWRTRQDSNL